MSGLAPLYSIGPRSDVRRWTGAMSGKVFYGRTDGRTADKKRRKNFVLGLPQKAKNATKIKKISETKKIPWINF